MANVGPLRDDNQTFVFSLTKRPIIDELKNQMSVPDLTTRPVEVGATPEYDSTRRLPTFLESFENLIGHFDEHFGELGSNERGDTFLDLANKVISLTDEGQEFPPLQQSEKKSHDGGVDLYTAETADGRILCAQSKYKIRTKNSTEIGRAHV